MTPPGPSKKELDVLLKFYKDRRFDDALTFARGVIDQFPKHQFTWKVLGIVLDELGKKEEALVAHKRAVNLDLNDAGALYNLARALHLANRLFESETNYKKAIVLKPDYVQAYYNLGVVHEQQCNLVEAEECFRYALRLDPCFSEAHNNLALVFHQLDRFDEAETVLKKAIRLKHNNPEAHNNLSITLQALDRLPEAEIISRRAIALKPDFSEAYYNLGLCLHKMCKTDEAHKAFGRAIKLQPNYADAHYALSLLLREKFSFEEAEGSVRRAIALKPNFLEAYSTLGEILKTLGRFEEAEESYREAILFDPSNASAHFNLGRFWMKMKRWDQALSSFNRALSIDPDLQNLLGFIVHAKQQICDWSELSLDVEQLSQRIRDGKSASTPMVLHAAVDDPELHFKASVIYATKKFPRSTVLPSLNKNNYHNKIKIGYFSPDFRDHPLSFLVVGLLELHDRDKFEIHAFSFGDDTDDELNLRVKAGVDYFHDVRAISDLDVACLSRSLEIDIAVDLAGYTSGNRTAIFAMSAAPIQLMYCGFLGTMGIDYYDYVVSDKIMIPQINQKYFTEKVFYLPSFQVNSSHHCFNNTKLTRDDFGIPNDAFIFSCFNAVYKITPEVFDAWARILGKVEGSFLFLCSNDLLVIENLRKNITLRGVDPDRLIFGKRLKGEEYWARYQAVDLFLDTLNYNGGVTTSDALRKGCPLVTCLGDTYSSRMGASLLTAVGLPELIANTLDEYERLAIEIAFSPAKLQAIKNRLNSNLIDQPLYNTDQFTSYFEQALELSYQKSQRGEKPEHIYISEA